MPSLFRRVPWPALGLLICVSLLWMYSTDRWAPSDWSLPVDYDGDALEVALRVQVAADQGLTQLNTFGEVARLGWPAHADWSLYPTPDRAMFLLTGQLSRAWGIFGAINAAMGLIYLLNAVGFYAAARTLRWSQVWAVAGALLYAFTFHHYRWSNSLSLSLTAAWPLSLVLWRWVCGSGRPPAGTRPWLLLAAGCGLVHGLGNPYYTFLAGQFAAFALLRALWTGQPARRQVGAVFLIALLAGFALTHAPYFLARLGGESTGELARNFQGTELYALRPIEFLIPPERHWADAFARLGCIYNSGTFFRGAERSDYLGILALLGLVVLLSSTVRTLAPQPPAAVRRRLPEATWVVGWAVLFGMVGGFNTVLGLAGLDLFRAASRYAFLPGLIGLLFVLRACQRLTRPHPRFAAGAAVAVTLFGLWDQLPRPKPTREREEMRTQVALDQATARALTGAVGESAAVFQFPAVPFPEAGPVNGFRDYQHVPNALWAPQLRLSYGGLPGSYAERLSQWIARQPPDRMVAALEAAGADAVTIDRRAYPDRGAALAQGFLAAGKSPIALPAASPLLAFALSPATTPVFPAPDDARMQVPWRDPAVVPPPTATATPRLFATRGWLHDEFDAHGNWRWANQTTSVLTVYRDMETASTVDLTFNLAALVEAPVRISWRGQMVWQGQVTPVPQTVTLPNLPCAARQSNELKFELDHDLARTRYDARTLGIKVANLRVRSTD